MLCGGQTTLSIELEFRHRLATRQRLFMVELRLARINRSGHSSATSSNCACPQRRAEELSGTRHGNSTHLARAATQARRRRGILAHCCRDIARRQLALNEYQCERAGRRHSVEAAPTAARFKRPSYLTTQFEVKRACPRNAGLLTGASAAVRVTACL